MRARVDGEVVDIAEFLKRDERLARYEQHKIEVIIDRLVRRDGIERRLTDSLETALKLADGVAEVELMPADGSESETLTFSQHLACPKCGTSYDEPAPRNFSFNSPYGACEACDGLGTTFEVDPELVIPDPDQSINGGAIAPWRTSNTQYFTRMLEAVAEVYKLDLDAPYRTLTAKQQKVVLHGVEGNLKVKYKNRYGRTREYSTAYEGVIPWLNRRRTGAESDWSREQYEGYMREVPCTACGGARLKPASLAVTVNDLNIAEVCDMAIGESAKFLAALELSERDRLIAERVTKEINARLGFLLDVGLDYLSLSRYAATLAGGEAQRIRLASQIGSGLVGTLYVLDEPSIGLHQRDNRRLIDTLLRLRDLGNTVLVVEHDEETIREADWIVDIGPGAGEHGGDVVYSGPVKGITKVKESITGQYLAGKKSIPLPTAAPSARPRVAGDQGRARAQPAQHRRADPARLLRRHHRRQRQRQEHAGARHPAAGADAADLQVEARGRQAQEDRRSRSARQGDRHGSVTDRSHTTIEPGHLHRCVRQHPQAVRHHRRGEGPRLHARALQLQRAGRSLRGVLRRRHDQDRDALPARRVRAVRGVQGRSLQPRHARHRVQGQEHRRGARHAGRRGRRRSSPTSRPSVATCRRCSMSVSVTCGSASRRRRCRVARRSE